MFFNKKVGAALILNQHTVASELARLTVSTTTGRLLRPQSGGWRPGAARGGAATIDLRCCRRRTQPSRRPRERRRRRARSHNRRSGSERPSASSPPRFTRRRCARRIWSRWMVRCSATDKRCTAVSTKKSEACQGRKVGGVGVGMVMLHRPQHAERLRPHLSIRLHRKRNEEEADALRGGAVLVLLVLLRCPSPCLPAVLGSWKW